jgi:chitinase
VEQGGGAVLCLLLMFLKHLSMIGCSSWRHDGDMRAFIHGKMACLLALACSMAMSGPAFAQLKVVGYYPAWLQGVLPADEVQYENLTHINVAFSWPLSDGTITSYANLPYPELVDAAHQAGTVVLTSMGGYGQSDGFSPMAADSVARANFVQNLVTYLETNNYDGVDLDWEFPMTTADRANQNLLIRDIRNAFDAAGQTWLITMAVTISDYVGRWNDYAFMTPYIDWYNLLSYDIHGPWFTHAGHNSPLYAPPTDYDGSVHQGVLYLNLQRGVPLSKILLGVPFYGREFNASQLYGPSTGGTEFTYNTVPGKLASGWTYHWDAVSFVPYLTNPANTLLASYDDTTAVRIKCEYARDTNLGGVMIWALGQDIVANEQPLLEAIGATMITSVPVNPPTSPADFVLHDNYPNPFNPSTTIRFSMKVAGRATLTIVDLLGREITTLVDAEKSPGEHSYAWDAGGIAGGVYVYRLRIEPHNTTRPGRIFNASKKLILLR